MGNDRYDVVVVGAGPAGSTAALLMAKNNLSVALLERGPYPGSKNVSGCTIASEAFREIIPEYWAMEGIPLERAVVTDEIWFLDNESAVKMGFTGKKFGKAPYNKFTVLRYKFDRWFADQAVKAGAKLFTNCTAVDLVYHKTGIFSRKVDGVKAEGGDIIHGDIVILAEGACAALTEKAGMRKRMRPENISLYVKEVLELPAEKIEDRFHLEKGEGATIGMMGYPTSPAIGKGGIWTNKDTLSVAVGAILDQITEKGLNPLQLLDRFKKHTMVKKLLEGAKPVKYMAQIIPKGGYHRFPAFYDAGIMVVGNAAQIISGLRGVDLAMLSGAFAAEAAVQACARDDYSKEILAAYGERIKSSFFYANMKKGRNTEAYYAKYQDSDLLVTKALNDVAYKYMEYTIDDYNDKVIRIISELENIQPLKKTIGDLLAGAKNWGVF